MAGNRNGQNRNTQTPTRAVNKACIKRLGPYPIPPAQAAGMNPQPARATDNAPNQRLAWLWTASRPGGGQRIHPRPTGPENRRTPRPPRQPPPPAVETAAVVMARVAAELSTPIEPLTHLEPAAEVATYPRHLPPLGKWADMRPCSPTLDNARVLHISAVTCTNSTFLKLANL